MSPLEKLLTHLGTKAVIFDMDGTMINNHVYHLQAWQVFLRRHGLSLTEETYKQKMNGYATREAVSSLFDHSLDTATTNRYVLEKEGLYRHLYGKSIQPVAGLTDLLLQLQLLKVPMAIATSAIRENVDFMFDHIPVQQFFDVVVDASHIAKGKPDPEIYLTTARLLQVAPAHCLVFEDAIAGIQSARLAGMKVIALSTTNRPELLTGAKLVIKDYTALHRLPIGQPV